MTSVDGGVVVVGDALLDVDIDGAVNRICPDAPAPVLEVEARLSRPGGAGLAASLAARSGVPVTLVCAIADDEPGSELRALLAGHGVHVVALPSSAATPVKQRIRSDHHTLVRLDTGGTADPLRAPLDRTAVEAISAARAVLVADYGRGMCSLPSVRDALIGAAGPIVWDPHPRGAAPVRRTTVATPNQREVLELAGDGRGTGRRPLPALTEAARRVLVSWEIGALAVTRGAEGSLLIRPEGPPSTVPAPRVDGSDPCGAGDAFAAAAAVALASGHVLSAAVEEATAAASGFVAAGGGGSVEGIWSTGPASPATAEAPADRPGRDPVVVAAGGCFDLLHAGHVALLEQARGLGDRLVVLLNSDASVRRLKGPDRPLQSADDRRRVLLALESVDDVVVFDEDTPEAVLDQLRPGVFAKGGDYAGLDIAEAQVMDRWGGQVVFLPYLGGRSTTRLVEGARRGT